MPVLGLTKLEAVNEILEVLGERPHPALDSGGASMAAQGERVLDRETRRILTQGFPSNTDYNIELTPAGSGNLITAPANTLWLRGSHRRHRNRFVLRGDAVYDTFEGSTDMGSADPIEFDVVRNLDFEDCPPDLKDLIVADAKVIMQRRIRGDAQLDSQLLQERDRQDITADRDTTRADPRMVRNDQPLLTRPAQQDPR